MMFLHVAASLMNSDTLVTALLRDEQGDPKFECRFFALGVPMRRLLSTDPSWQAMPAQPTRQPAAFACAAPCLAATAGRRPTSELCDQQLRACGSSKRDLAVHASIETLHDFNFTHTLPMCRSLCVPGITRSFCCYCLL